jgi:glycosyltransferase involved in cell wall biosynthesis
MELVFTDYLRKTRTYVPARRLRPYDATGMSFPVEASVVIPVRDREKTIAEAVRSALSQKTNFPFNVIVVDNHSTDGTTCLLRDLARRHGEINHVIPERTDLAIGGCWNEAIRSPSCGRYAVQLDSDDLYRDRRTLQRMVDMMREGYAMVIGAYTLVDFDLSEIPPGLIAHNEWTDENGHNNALRVNGLGAPRAFATALMREAGLLNVSYGEDYAAALRVCREYRVGRIYESLYLCRRWPGNTDAGLDLDRANRNDAFKDDVRTAEILARQAMNREAEEKP